MVNGSESPNVLPEKSSVTFNCRILPGETVDGVVKHIKNVVNNPKIKIEKLEYNNPSKISRVDSEAFKNIEKTIYEIFPQSIVCPYLVTGSTDTVKYDDICENAYRFSPYLISSSDLDRMHGIDERISIENYRKAICFFIKLIKEDTGTGSLSRKQGDGVTASFERIC